jgi:hypothetical protein
MQIRYLQPLSRAWDRTVAILFRPFEPVTWLVLAFAAWLAGLGSGGGTGSTVSNTLDMDELGRGWLPGTGRSFDHLFDRMWALPFVALAVLVLIAVAVALLWLSSRAKLVWLESAVAGRPAIVEPWSRLGRLGDSLFLWRLGFALVVIVVGVVLAGVIIGPAALLHESDVLDALSFAAILVGVIAATILAATAAVVALLLDAFVVPIMYRFRLTATEAWKALLPWLRSMTGTFVLFVLFSLLLAVVFGMIYTVVILLTCCLAALPYVGTLLLLPFWLTWRLFTVEFLAQLDPGFDLFERHAVVVASEEGE